MSEEIREKRVDCDAFALPKYRYMELKYFALQYSYWKYVLEKIEAGEWDMTKEIARHPGNYYKDPTCAAVIFKGMLEDKIELIEEALDKVRTCNKEIKPLLLRSVTTEISYEALCERHGLKGVTADEFYKSRMEFFHNLDVLG